MPTFSKYLTSKRGAQQLLDSDGYIYTRKKDKDTSLSSAWRCCKFGAPTKCPCRCYLALSDNSISMGARPHNHDADGTAPERREVLATLKRKAAEQPLSLTQNLISETLADTTPELNNKLPNMESLARVVQRSRALSNGSAQHQEAATSEEFLLPPTCTSTRRDENFVLYNGTTDRDVRIIAFATRRNMETLAHYTDWIADGTFYISPKIFPQSYTIHSVVENKCIPLIYILSGDKKGDTYEHIFNVIKFYFDQHCPVDTGTILVDFEKAVMNACLKSLPGWEVSNCFFHLCQAVQKHIQKQFKKLYFQDKLFARASRLVVFLAFVPVADVEDAFYEITYYIQTSYPRLMVVVNYFEKTYLGLATVDSEVRVPPVYPLEFWNHYSRIHKDPEFPRTSNMVEGFHRGFKSRVHRPKPSVQEYVRAIKEQQVITDFHLDRLSVGKTPSKRRRVNHSKLYDLCCFYSTYSSKLEYLFEVAKVFGHDIE